VRSVTRLMGAPVTNRNGNQLIAGWARLPPLRFCCSHRRAAVDWHGSTLPFFRLPASGAVAARGGVTWHLLLLQLLLASRARLVQNVIITVGRARISEAADRQLKSPNETACIFLIRRC
jgi:hypothetical protein